MKIEEWRHDAGSMDCTLEYVAEHPLAPSNLHCYVACGKKFGNIHELKEMLQDPDFRAVVRQEAKKEREEKSRKDVVRQKDQESLATVKECLSELER